MNNRTPTKIRNNDKITVFVEQAIFSLYTLLLNVISARFLSPTDFGIIVFINIFLFLSVGIQNSIFFKTLTVKLAREKIYNDRIRYIVNIIIINALYNTILNLLITLFISLRFSLSLNSTLIVYVYLLSFNMYETSRRIKIASESFTSLVITTSIRFILFIFSFIFFIINEYVSINLILILCAISSAIPIISFYFKGFLSTKDYDINARVKEAFVTFKFEWNKSNFIFKKYLTQFFTVQIYPMISGIFFPSSQLAKFEIFRTCFAPLSVFINGLNNYYFVVLSKYYVDSKNTFIKKLFSLSFTYLTIGTVYSVIMYLSFEKIDTLIFEGKYSKNFSSGYLIIVAIFSVCTSINLLYENYFPIADKNKTSFKISIYIFVVNIFLLPYLFITFLANGMYLGIFINQLLILLSYILVISNYHWKELALFKNK